MADSHRVLVVDDEASIRKLLIGCLRDEGCEAEGASNGDEAQQALADGDFGLVLLDLNLPDVDGGELLARIRQPEGAPEVIVLSGQVGTDAAVAAMENGAFAYVQKPFDIDKLMAASRRALAKVAGDRESSPPAEGLRAEAVEASAPMASLDQGLAQPYRELAAQERRSQAVLDAIADGVVTCGPDGKVDFINAAAQAMLVLPPGQALGRAWHELVGVPEEECPLRRALTSGETVRDAECVVRRKAGKRSRVYVSTGIFRDEAGEIAGAAAAFREVGEEKDLEQIRSTFITAAAHQLRTPLTSVRGYVELLLSSTGAELSETQRGYLEAVQRSCRRLEKVVGAVLDLARVEAGALEVECQPVDVALLVREAVATAAPQAEDAGVSVELTSEPDSLVMQSDPARLMQVVEELLTNALRHTPRGGSIRVATQPNDGGARIVVTDTGVGVPAEAQSRLFEVFFRVEGSQVRDAEGAGLGLAIAQAIVGALGGTLEVESVLGRGSTFTITLPERPVGEDGHGSDK
ncbi:MAG: ATP-binding protein [Armatimonadota bacterium]